MAFASASRRAISTSHSLPAAQPISLTKSITHETTGVMVATSAGPEKRSRTASLSDSNSHWGRESGAIYPYISGVFVQRKAEIWAQGIRFRSRPCTCNSQSNWMRWLHRVMRDVFVQVCDAKQQLQNLA